MSAAGESGGTSEGFSEASMLRADTSRVGEERVSIPEDPREHERQDEKVARIIDTGYSDDDVTTCSMQLIRIQ